MIISMALVICASVVFFVAQDYYRKCKKSSDINKYLIVMGIACTLWNIGYAFLGFSEVIAQAKVWRFIGLFGADCFLIGEMMWFAYKGDINKTARFFMGLVMGGISIADLVMFAVGEDKSFVIVDGITFYLSADTVGEIAHVIYLGIVIVMLIALIIRWKMKTIYARDRRFRFLLTLTNIFMFLATVPDFLFPRLGIEIVSTAPIGGALTYLFMVYIANRFHTYDICEDNLSTFMYENVKTAFMAFDMDRHLLVMNPAASRMLGITNVRGQRISELFELNGMSEKTLFERAAAGEDCFRFQSREQDRKCTVYLNVAKDENDENYCYICTVFDMTEEGKMINELIEASDAKSSFLANMSHEIRTPINAILGMNEMIYRESSDAQVKNYAMSMQESGKKLLSTVNDILDYSKLESGKMDIIPVEYRLSSILNELMQDTYDETRKKGIELITQVDPEIPDFLYGDEIKVAQILRNLLNNACQYTNKGSITVKANYARRDEEEIVLIVEVADTGKGIQPDEQRHIFDAFEWADQKRSKNVEGSGLGLAIVGQYVRMMRGNISLKSTYGKGSIFTLRLTQRVVSFDPIGDFETRFKMFQQERDRNEQQTFRAPGARILIADDNDMNLKVASLLLHRTQIQIDTAVNGREALELIDKKEYHVIFLDHLMPELDGVETLKQINEKGLAEGTPIIALTANAVSGAKEMYLDYGFTDYMAKPILGRALEKTLLQYLPAYLIEKDRANSENNEEYEDEGTVVLDTLDNEEKAKLRRQFNRDVKDNNVASGRDDDNQLTHIFIINPTVGNRDYMSGLRDILDRRTDIRSFIFTSAGAGDETEIVRKVQNYFDKGRLRIYSCGGSGTARNILNGIEDFGRVELAICPGGMTNDFMKTFGSDEEYFKNIENLIDGETQKIDYIRTNHGLALNTFSTGLDSRIVNKVENYRNLRVFGRMAPYVLAFLNTIFKATPLDYEVYIDNRLYEGKMGEIFFGNGVVLGGMMHFDKEAMVADGRAVFMLGGDYQGITALPLVSHTIKGRKEKFEKYSIYGECRSIRIRRKDDKPVEMNFDGELVKDVTEWKAEIIKQGLDFVLPKGVTIHG